MKGPLGVSGIAALVARDLEPGWCVNLGIGMPLAVGTQVDADRELILHSENGILGMRPLLEGETPDADIVDAAKQHVALRKGGAYTSHADSFALIRGGHVDASIMGALQVSGSGDLANWWDGNGVPGVGGAMDLAVGARRVFVMMRHSTPEGDPKLVEQCTAPLTAEGCVDMVYTDYGVFRTSDAGLVVKALARGTDLDELQLITGVPLVVSGPVETVDW